MSDTRFEMTRWAELERSLKRRFDVIEDYSATPSTILLAVLNAVADANLYVADAPPPGHVPTAGAGGYVYLKPVIDPERRERIATAAMQGVLTSMIFDDRNEPPRAAMLACVAVEHADALIAELDKGGGA